MNLQIPEMPALEVKHSVSFEVPGEALPYRERAYLLRIKGVSIDAMIAAGKHPPIRSYQEPKSKEYQEIVAQCARFAMGSLAPFEGACRMKLTILMQIPESWSNKKKVAAFGQPHLSTPDRTNITKLFEDGLKGIVWLDDKQAFADDVIKIYAKTPGVIVYVEEVAPAGLLPFESPLKD